MCRLVSCQIGKNGNKTPRGDSIAKLAKYFGVSADYLLGLTEAQTIDTDLRAVADYTGLTENAILALKDSEMFECYDRSQKKYCLICFRMKAVCAKL